MTENKKWTIEALKEYIDVRFDALDKAVLKAENSADKRFDGVNEFRAQLGDQARTFIPRIETEKLLDSYNLKNDTMFKNLNDKLLDIDKKLEKIENIKQGGNIMWVYVGSAISFLLALVTLIVMMVKIF